MALAKKGIDVRETAGHLLFRVSLKDSAGAKVTSGTTEIRIYEVQSDGSIKWYDWSANTFGTGTPTDEAQTMTHRTRTNEAGASANTGLWTYALATLTGFTVGGIYIVQVTNTGATPESQEREFQFGGQQGDLLPPTAAGYQQADVLALAGGTQSATDLKDFADTGYDPSTHLASATGRPLPPAIRITGTSSPSMVGVYVAVSALTNGAPSWVNVDDSTRTLVYSGSGIWQLKLSGTAKFQKTDDLPTGTYTAINPSTGSPVATPGANSLTATDQTGDAYLEVLKVLQHFGLASLTFSGTVSPDITPYTAVPAGDHDGKPYWLYESGDPGDVPHVFVAWYTDPGAWYVWTQETLTLPASAPVTDCWKLATGWLNGTPFNASSTPYLAQADNTGTLDVVPCTDFTQNGLAMLVSRYIDATTSSRLATGGDGDTGETLSDQLDTLATAVTSIRVNTRVNLFVPDFIEVPDEGAILYDVHLYLYDEEGNMEAPDSAPTVALTNQAGTNRASRLSAGTMTLVTTGHYKVTYTSTAGDAREQLLWSFNVIEGTLSRYYGGYSMTGDADYRTTLSAIQTRVELALPESAPGYSTGLPVCDTYGRVPGVLVDAGGEQVLPTNFTALAIDASGGVSLSSASDLYQATVTFGRLGNSDEYVVRWYKNGVRLDAGVIAATITVRQTKSPATVLINNQNLGTGGAAYGYFTYTGSGAEATENGVLYDVGLSATIDGSTRTASATVWRDA